MLKQKVHFTKLENLVRLKNILPEFKKRIGVKVHFGEQGNITFIPATLIKVICDMVTNPALIECSVLYKSPRNRASTHRELALKNGFDFAPIDFLDGETGDDSLEVPLNGKYIKKAYLGKNLEKYESLLVLSHFKGHQTEGFGGAIKNLGMGLASRRGKLSQHAATQHNADKAICAGCGYCLENCPVKAIKLDSENKAEIMPEICISCSKCISNCQFGAVSIPWDKAKEKVQKRTAEYAKAAAAGRQCFYVNFLINITRDCDCSGLPQVKLMEDIGILASSDPVAIDQASLDMVLKHYKSGDRFNGQAQLEHAREIGLGNREYQMVVF